MSAFDPKRQMPNPALRPCARIATFLDFRWPFAQSQVAPNGYFAEILRTAPTSAKLSLAHGDFYFACERDRRKCE